MAAIFSSVRSSQQMPAAGRGPSRRQSITRSGVTMKSSRNVVAGQRDRPGRADLEFVHGGDADGVRSDQARRGGQRELQVGEPAALAQPRAVLPGRDAAHHHQVDGGQVGQRDPRAERLAPLIEAALRGGSLSRAGSRAKNGSGSASRGTAM